MRAFIRHPADIPIQVLRGQRSSPARRHLHDISLGGLSFDFNQALERGSMLQVRFPCIDPDFEATVRVAWCKPHEVDALFEVGASFVDEEGAYRVRMVEQVCHIEQYRRRVREQEGRELSRQEAALEWIDSHAAEFPAGGVSNG